MEPNQQKPQPPVKQRRISRVAALLLFLGLCFGGLFVFLQSGSPSELDALRERIAANGGSTLIVPTPFSFFVGTLLKTIGAGSKSGSVAALDKFVLNVPSGFRFTPEELQLLSRNRRIVGFEFQGSSEEVPLNHLERMTWLKTLIFDRMVFSESSLQAIPKFTALKTLAFRNMTIDQQIVNSVNESPNLEYLHFYNCRFAPELVSATPKNERLKIVGVDKNGYSLDDPKDWLNRIPTEIRTATSPTPPTPTPDP